MLKISTAPHMSSKKTTKGIMIDVIIALIPAFVAALLMFGLNALMIVVTAIASCVLFEYLMCRYVMHAPSTLGNCSAIVTGLLLAFNLPSNIPLFLVLLGSFMAIVVGKMAFGGIGKNIFNPALVGRVFLFISFPAYMSTWPKPTFLAFMNTDSVTSATPLAIMKYADVSTSATKLGNLPDYWQMFLGNTGGCLGETSAIALLLGLVYMLAKRIIDWKIPCFYVATVFLLFSIMHFVYGTPNYDPLAQILSGGLMLGAIFMATDYTTSPMTDSGRVVFAIGCGVLTFVIREYSVYPEGVSFAILIMNAFVPLIDKIYVPRIFGLGKK